MSIHASLKAACLLKMPCFILLITCHVTSHFAFLLVWGTERHQKATRSAGAIYQQTQRCGNGHQATWYRRQALPQEQANCGWWCPYCGSQHSNSRVAHWRIQTANVVLGGAAFLGGICFESPSHKWRDGASWTNAQIWAWHDLMSCTMMHTKTELARRTLFSIIYAIICNSQQIYLVPQHMLKAQEIKYISICVLKCTQKHKSNAHDPERRHSTERNSLRWFGTTAGTGWLCQPDNRFPACLKIQQHTLEYI